MAETMRMAAFQRQNYLHIAQPVRESEQEPLSVEGYAKRDEIPLLRTIATRFRDLSHRRVNYSVEVSSDRYRLSDEKDYELEGIPPGTRFLPLHQSEVKATIRGTTPVDYFIRVATQAYALEQDLNQMKGTDKNKQDNLDAWIDRYVMEALLDLRKGTSH